MYVAGTRISLDSVVCAFNRGDSPERILERYPLLSKAARVYGAIAFYRDHQAEIDAYIKAGKREFEDIVLAVRRCERARVVWSDSGTLKSWRSRRNKTASYKNSVSFLPRSVSAWRQAHVPN